VEEAWMKYHLYIDEVGNSDLGSSNDPNHRYLSLTGVILEIEYDTTIITPAIEELKYTYFGSNSTEPIILHRKELMNKNYPFESLRDPIIENLWNCPGALGTCQTVSKPVK
jgi:hypothetical protein